MSYAYHMFFFFVVLPVLLTNYFAATTITRAGAHAPRLSPEPSTISRIYRQGAAPCATARSLLGLVKTEDALAVAALADVELDEEALEGWDGIVL
jgi:hypothetical protein